MLAIRLPAKGELMAANLFKVQPRFEGHLLLRYSYTQSRLRQLIFGGATSHVLANAMLLVFMAH